MGRKIFTFAAGASAVLCIAACGLWVRSYRSGDAFSGYTRAASYSCDVGCGRVWVARDTRWGRPEGWSFTHATTHPPHPIATPTGTLGRLGDEDHVLRQTRLYRGAFYSLVALDHLYHLEHHLYPQVPHQNWKRLARRLDAYFEEAGLKPHRVF
jgi:hypothetical protein